MTDINHVVLVGHLTRDGEFSYIPSGTAKMNLGLAVNEGRKVQEGWQDYANYFDVVIWGKSAENLQQYLKKGKQVAVSGHLQQQRWQKDGKNYSRVVVVADQVQLCGGRDGSAPAPALAAAAARDEPDDGYPEDIPF